MWHTVKEEPEIGKKYYILRNDSIEPNLVSVAEYRIDDFDNVPYFFIGDDYIDDVTFWMEYDLDDN